MKFFPSIDGYYEFSFSGYANSKNTIIEVKKNENKELSFHGDTNGNDHIGSTWKMKLVKGDKLKLYVKEGMIYSGEDYSTIFNGKFLWPF